MHAMISISPGLVAGLALQSHAVALPRLRSGGGCSMRLADDGVLGVGLIGAGRIVCLCRYSTSKPTYCLTQPAI